MQAGEIGRCTAASTARSSVAALCAKADAKAASGSQIRPLPSGASFGANGCGGRAIEHVGNRLALVRRQRRDIDQRLDARASVPARSRRRHRRGPPARSVPRRRSRLRFSAATSSASEVSGSGAATALMPSASSAVITRAQLEPSAHAPWASTTLTSLDRHLSALDLVSNL